MKLGVHYSSQVVELLEAGAVEFDCFKCPAWPEVIEQAQAVRPAYIHFPLLVGAGMGDALDGETGQVADWAQIERLLHKTDTPYVNLHLTPMIDHHPDIDINSSDPAHVERVAEALLRDLEVVIRRLGADKVIVENIPATDTRVIRIAMHPALIQQVVNHVGCGFLLDIAHAQLTAPTFGIHVKDYLTALPVQHIREIHISGVQMLVGEWLERMQTQLPADSEFLQRYGGGPMDHLPMTDTDWDVLAWAIEQIRSGAWSTPWVGGFEYSGTGLWQTVTKTEVLREQLPRLYHLLCG